MFLWLAHPVLKMVVGDHVRSELGRSWWWGGDGEGSWALLGPATRGAVGAAGRGDSQGLHLELELGSNSACPKGTGSWKVLALCGVCLAPAMGMMWVPQSQLLARPDRVGVRQAGLSLAQASEPGRTPP